MRDHRALTMALNTPCPVKHAAACLKHLADISRHQGSVSQEQARQTMAAMAGELVRFPPELVEKACRAYADSNGWFPAWADLRGVLEPLVEEWRTTLRRLELLIEKADAAKALSERSTKGPISEDMRGKVNALLSRLAAKTPNGTAPTGEVAADRPTPRYIKDFPDSWLQDRANQTREVA